MDPKLQSVIEKIRRLRALSTSANVNEAANAAAAADKLLQEYRLSEAELESNDSTTTLESATLDVDPIVAWNQRVTSWQSFLANMLAKHYGCSGIIDYKNNPKFLIVGRPSDVATVRYMYAWLGMEIVRLARIHGKGMGKSWSDSFCKGAVAGIKDAMTKAETVVRATQTSTALAVVDQRKVDSRNMLEKIYPNIRPRQSVGARDRSAYTEGFEKGKSISDRGKLPTSAGPKLLSNK